MARNDDELPGGGVGVPDPMEQVRELLFGEARRSAEQNFTALEAKLEAMRADFLARFAALESHLADVGHESEKNRAASVEAIGAAISQLGATVQNLSVRRKGG